MPPRWSAGHVVHRVRAQQAHAVQLAPVAQELQKAGVVQRGGHEAPAAALHGGHLAGGRALSWARRHRGSCAKGSAMRCCCAGGTAKPVSTMPSGAKISACKKAPKPCPLITSTKRPQHIGGAAVGPHAAGLKLQRHAGQRLAKLGVGALARGDLDLCVLLLHGRGAQKFIGQPRRVAQQVLPPWPLA